MIVDPHGNGAQGRDGLQQTVGGIADAIRRDRSRVAAIVLFPQAEVGRRWLDGDMEELLIAELDRTLAEFNGDPARTYLTGFSTGATGPYRIAYRWPNRFAAIVAIADRVDSSDAAVYSERDKQADRAANPFVTAADPFSALAARIRHVPIRLFHGDAAERMPVDKSRRFAKALEAAHADVSYQEYAGPLHVDAARKAYLDRGVVSWLLAQRR